MGLMQSCWIETALQYIVVQAGFQIYNVNAISPLKNIKKVVKEYYNPIILV